ncbi:hypothetical protein [Rathayibacter sp. VKM Ac-2927]|uniref:hypothetical protein n=1 Tax=Rathayibacter sp. VKM Ac-2927 TaxID=2929478 RepID=UPI001FB1FA8F|nr:hypothetical protein [Rathayibacter sp. VKM Ac-2927]MCJ1685526.1 hypothetical protein [Rathayibacter sp. VKM Ac-2927]
MQTLYTSMRRIVAALLIVLLLIVSALTALHALDTPAIIVVAGALVAGALLASVAVRRTPMFGLDMLAFLSAALAISVSWGSGVLEPGFLIHLPALISAIAFATMALMLRTEAGAAVTKDRL